MKLKTGVLLLAALLFATPAFAYQLVSIPPDGLYLIVCGNGEIYPWQTAGPNGVDVMNGVAIGLCRGTLVTNTHVHVNRAEVKRLLLEQRPRTFSERAVEPRGRSAGTSEHDFRNARPPHGGR